MTRKIVKRSIFFFAYFVLAAAKVTNAPPTSSIPNYNINLANKSNPPPSQPQPKPQQSSENYFYSRELFILNCK